MNIHLHQAASHRYSSVLSPLDCPVPRGDIIKVTTFACAWDMKEVFKDLERVHTMSMKDVIPNSESPSTLIVSITGFVVTDLNCVVLRLMTSTLLSGTRFRSHISAN